MPRQAPALLISLLLVLTGCGYVGDPLPPALNIPNTITDLSALQRGGKLIVEFTIPAKTTEGLAVGSVEAVELRAGPNSKPVFQVDEWAGGARLLKTDSRKPGDVHIEEPIEGWQGKEVILAVRLINRKGRASAWSNLVILPVSTAVAVPAAAKAEATPEGVRLTWNAADATGFRVYRGAGELARTDKPEYLDKDTQFGNEYIYAVQAVRKAGETTAESDLSPVVKITPLDIFPPAAPVNAAAITGTASIELNWDRNLETDFKGYRVYRATGGGEFEKIADGVEAPAYSDRTIKPGLAYKYAITAVDQSGNESQRSNVVEITAP